MICFRTNKLEQLVELDKVSMNGTVYASGYQVLNKICNFNANL